MFEEINKSKFGMEAERKTNSLVNINQSINRKFIFIRVGVLWHFFLSFSKIQFTLRHEYIMYVLQNLILNS